MQIGKVKYNVICEPLAGETECGDQYLAKELTDCTLFAVVDGLGHGPQAAHAAKKAIETIGFYPDKALEGLLTLCDEALHETRGAAVTIVRIDLEYKLTYLGIGNVMGVCWKREPDGKLQHETFFLEGGIVGARLPIPMQTKEIALSPGDTFILATDGLKIPFETEAPRLDSPDKIANHIFSTYRNLKDDGLILVGQLL